MTWYGNKGSNYMDTRSNAWCGALSWFKTHSFIYNSFYICLICLSISVLNLVWFYHWISFIINFSIDSILTKLYQLYFYSFSYFSLQYSIVPINSPNTKWTIWIILLIRPAIRFVIFIDGRVTHGLYSVTRVSQRFWCTHYADSSIKILSSRGNWLLQFTIQTPLSTGWVPFPLLK